MVDLLPLMLSSCNSVHAQQQRALGWLSTKQPTQADRLPTARLHFPWYSLASTGLATARWVASFIMLLVRVVHYQCTLLVLNSGHFLAPPPKMSLQDVIAGLNVGTGQCPLCCHGSMDKIKNGL